MSGSDSAAKLSVDLSSVPKGMTVGAPGGPQMGNTTGASTKGVTDTMPLMQ